MVQIVKVAAAPNTKIWLDQFEISGFANSGSQDLEQENIDAKTFSTVGPSVVTGNYMHKSAFTILADYENDQSDEIISSLLMSDTDHYLSSCWGSNAEGSVSYDSIVKLARDPIAAATGQLQVINADLAGAGGICRGLVLCNATISGTGNRTGRNQGATTAGQTYHATIRAISGTFVSVTVRIQESTDDGGGDPYADITGLSATLTSASVARVTTTSATEAWKRVRIHAFTGTSVVLVVTAGLVAA